jgi:hypothetical protein
MLDFCERKNVDVRTYPEQRRRRKKMTNVFYMELNDLNYELERSAEILRVLAHPVRLQIVHQLLGLTIPFRENCTFRHNSDTFF